MTSSKAKKTNKSKAILSQELKVKEKKAQVKKVKKSIQDRERCDTNKRQNLELVKEIHDILLNRKTLSLRQKIDFCKNQRYFMKLYLREILKSLRRNF